MMAWFRFCSLIYFLVTTGFFVGAAAAVALGCCLLGARLLVILITCLFEFERPDPRDY